MLPVTTLKDNRPFGIAIIQTITPPPPHCRLMWKYSFVFCVYDLQSSRPSRENRFSSKNIVRSQLWFSVIQDFMNCTRFCLYIAFNELYAVSFYIWNHSFLSTFVPYLLRLSLYIDWLILENLPWYPFQLKLQSVF